MTIVRHTFREPSVELSADRLRVSWLKLVIRAELGWAREPAERHGSDATIWLTD